MTTTTTAVKKVLFLVSEDDPVLARVIKNKFEKEAGWQTAVANSFDDAIRAFDTMHPDAVMTEIIIHDPKNKTGFDIIAEIKGKAADKPGLPIIVFSDLQQEQDKERAMSLGATHYFSKREISMQDFIAELKKIVSAS